MSRVARKTAFEPLAAFLATRGMVIYAALVATHAYLRQWYSPPVAIGAILWVAARLPLLMADPQRIAQVIVNLVDNACKYSPVGKPIRLRARLIGDLVEIKVTDQGAKELQRALPNCSIEL